MRKEKACKGINKAVGYGCGKIVPTQTRKYGLCQSCFRDWVKSTEEGREYAAGFARSLTNKNRKEQKKKDSRRLEDMRVEVYGKENRKYLQIEVNRLARMIDSHFKLTCIDCSRPFANQQDGGHFHSVGSDAALRYNLHNIHSQRSECNQNALGGGRALEYYEGLIDRYGNEYAELVRYGLKRAYPVLKMSNREVYEKLKVARKLVRDFEKFVFKDPIQARTMLNTLLGIYPEIEKK